MMPHVVGEKAAQSGLPKVAAKNKLRRPLSSGGYLQSRVGRTNRLHYLAQSGLSTPHRAA